MRNDNIAPNKAWLIRSCQNIINQHSSNLKSMRSFWTPTYDEDGDLVDIVPNIEIVFKTDEELVVSLSEGPKNVH